MQVIASERLTALACMLIGVIVFAYVVGQVKHVWEVWY